MDVSSELHEKGVRRNSMARRVKTRIIVRDTNAVSCEEIRTLQVDKGMHVFISCMYLSHVYKCIIRAASLQKKYISGASPHDVDGVVVQQ